jgi:hypothetical protein
LAGREEEDQQQRRASSGPALGQTAEAEVRPYCAAREAELRPATAASSRPFSGQLRQRKRGRIRAKFDQQQQTVFGQTVQAVQAGPYSPEFSWAVRAIS